MEEENRLIQMDRRVVIDLDQHTIGFTDGHETPRMCDAILAALRCNTLSVLQPPHHRRVLTYERKGDGVLAFDGKEFVYRPTPIRTKEYLVYFAISKRDVRSDAQQPYMLESNE